MKNVRKFLCSLLVVACLSTAFIAQGVNVNASSTTVNFGASSTVAGHVRTWWPTGDSDGWSLTNGGSQSLRFVLTTSGNVLDAGFQRNVNGTRYIWHSGTIQGTSTGIATQVLTGPSGYYKPYLWNRNTSVTINTTTGSQATMR